MEFIAWVARFHPALVHLPIGILTIGIILQWISYRKPEWRQSPIIPNVYFFGFLFSALAAFAGWFLAREGGYQEDTIFWHRWLGILMVGISFLLWRLTRNPIGASLNGKLLSAGLFLGLLIVGHLGGEMTHGEEYLIENAPKFVQKLASYEEGSSYAVLDDPDSAQVYRDIISPILEKKCWSCHSDRIIKGGLNMENHEAFLKGGKNGKVIEGNAAGSELFKRVAMDPESKKFMPPKGSALSFGEVKLLEWWLDGGAPDDKTVAKFETPAEIQAILLRRHQLDTKPKSHIEKTKVEPVAEATMQKISEHGFSIRQIAINNNFVDVKWNGNDSVSVNAEISILAEVADQIAWLDLGNSGLSDDALSVVGKMSNLVRLKAEGNPITDAGVKSLKDLKHLESLNLYNTKITDICATDLSQLKSLKKLFIWQTGFGDEGTAQLESSLPSVEVIGGYKLNVAPTSD